MPPTLVLVRVEFSTPSICLREKLKPRRHRKNKVSRKLSSDGLLVSLLQRLFTHMERKMPSKSALLTVYGRSVVDRRDFHSYCPELAKAEARILLLGYLRAGYQVYSTGQPNVWLANVCGWRTIIAMEYSTSNHRVYMAPQSATIELEPAEARLCRACCLLYSGDAPNDEMAALLAAIASEQLIKPDDKFLLAQLLNAYRHERPEEVEFIDYIIERLAEQRYPTDQDTAFETALPVLVEADVITPRIVEERVMEALVPLRERGLLQSRIDRQNVGGWELGISFLGPVGLRSRPITQGEVQPAVDATKHLRSHFLNSHDCDFTRNGEGQLYLIEWEGPCYQPVGAQVGTSKIAGLSETGRVNLDGGRFTRKCRAIRLSSADNGRDRDELRYIESGAESMPKRPEKFEHKAIVFIATGE